MTTKRRRLRMGIQEILDRHGVITTIKHTKPLADAIADGAIDVYRRRKKPGKKQIRRKQPHARPMTVKELQALPYQEYLKSAHWKQVRNSALQGADFACRDCGAGGALQVHHKTYARLGCEKPRDLRVLCAGCHRKVHGKD